MTNWVQPFVFDGVYDKSEPYGPQCSISVKGPEPTPVLICIAKEDLRFAQGADKDNSQGLYLMERCSDGRLVLVESSGDMSRREISIEAKLQPQRHYELYCLSFMGNLKFSRIPYRLSIHSQYSLDVKMFPQFDSPPLLEGVLCDLEAHQNNHKRFTSEVYTLIHMCFMSSRSGVSNRVLAGSKSIQILVDAMKRFPKKQKLQQICASCIWNLGCSVELRPWMREHGIVTLLKETAARFYGEDELLEVCDAAARNIQNETLIAMDPHIENCILQDACTFSVTGNKTFLLQVWYDCFTCNLRSNYGVCQTCANRCHAGHELSPPKFSRFYCDCGGLPAEKRPPTVKPCICVRTDLEKKREKDKNYRDPEEDDPPAPNPKPKVAGPKKGGIATLFDK